ncbi:Asp/Glu/hydantoin racemase [Cohnella sp. CIP 111063]|uniref:aspartate/glutamate racemase family protein n=1 Tax=unclassified Cohnella TaxID=2636738 RepID=UPI000B8BF2D7|nr:MULTISPECIES: aspartate/glutamate racemase family protein [unclassified Cohnella]OXS54727.1 Asp/Glu/hydantoin racemase [Cohnella sp. CIP 111063]PRX64563.1 Asp/Glu/hydantoin racemase [Cohnella sp. SGD-V74]
MTKTVAAVYTGQGLAEPLKQVFNEVLPGCRLVNLIDDSLIADVMRAGGVTPQVSGRLLGYYRSAADLGADVILNTCSSVGEVVERARGFVDVPIVKIDEAMALEAVSRYARIGVIATLPTTLAPTMALLRAQAEAAGRTLSLTEGLAAGAYDALVDGKPEEHDRRIAETAAELAASVDAIVLAQGSMARMEASLRERTGKPVLSSPRLGVLAVKRLLEAQDEIQ